MTEIGHNSEAINGPLKSIVERIEKLEEEKQAIADDIKDVYAEAKSDGLDPKIIRKLISIRKQDSAKRAHEEQMLSVYLAALGME